MSKSCRSFFSVLKTSSIVSSNEVIRSHQQLQTQLRRDIHIRHTLAIAVFLIIIEILDDFFEHDAADVFKMTHAGLCFAEVA